MSEETEKNKPSENVSQKSGNNRHKYNRHRHGHHRPGNHQKEQAADSASETKQNTTEAQKNQQAAPKSKPPKKENHKNPNEKSAPVSDVHESVAPQKESGVQNKSRPAGSRKGNQYKQPLISSSPALFDTAPEDDVIFGRQSSQQKKVRPSYSAEELDQVQRFTDEELFGTAHLIYSPAVDESETVEVVSIKFKDTGKAYYFDPAGNKFSVHDFVIVDTARGPEFGEVHEGNKKVAVQNIIQPLRSVVRPATNDDISKHESNKKREKEAFGIALQKIAAHKLDMKLVDVQFAFDNSKILFYFTSAGRVDFRELVRDLASVFKTRIELRQIGIRDETKMLGGIGICGRPLCCSRFLGNFAQVSIKMAKEQGLSLNSGKISGNCGRLMCCLNFENQTYLDEIKLTPMPGSIVKIDGQAGTVTEATPLIGMLKVHLHNAPDGETVTVHRDSVSVVEKKVADNEENQPSND